MYPTEKLDATRPDFYAVIEQELVHLVGFETEWLAALSNAAALLRHQLDDINWAGFYLLKNGLLVLGPFQGKPACSAIVLGHGVCGAAALRQETIVVPDVHAFPGHIACDDASQSEIVVPIIYWGELKGVLDIDSPKKNRFLPRDKAGIEAFVAVLTRLLPWERVVF
ncbi:MAG: Free methionine-R-sulfoxide reductase [Firmicutes bacterium]|nr:Free methionine-R-sulfoxide reductase [Bacillota bacterium]